MVRRRERKLSLGGFDGARRLNTRGAASKGQQSDVARALDGDAKPTLMARANASHATGQNLAAFLDELSQNVGALIVDEVHLLDAELADLLLAEVLTLSAWTGTWTSRATRTAFATTAAGATFTAWTAGMAAFTARATLTSAFTFAAWSAFALRGSRSRGRSPRLFLFL